jgi:exonuclease III
MKIITWNCNGAFRKKYHLIEKMGADIIIIQECENPAETGGEYLNWASNYLWTGSNTHKGLGVFSKLPMALERLNWEDGCLELFLPCMINAELTLIAVWTKQANSPNFKYIGQFWKYLQINKNNIAANKTIICGDFNSNKRWDQWDRWWNHTDVIRELNEIGIKSAYHEIKKEEQGKELTPTFYMHHNILKPYHIDYVFLPNNLFSEKSRIVIGTSNDWLNYSDHMPLSIHL